MVVYSHSKLETYNQCPYKFKLKYVDKIKVDFKTIEAFLGSRVHEVLEKLYSDLRYKKLNTLQELLDYYKQRWKDTWTEDIIIVKKEYSAEQYYEMGIDYIKNYYEKNKPFNSDHTIDVEKHIKFKLDKEGIYIIEGYIDRLSYLSDGIYFVHDYKTSISMKTDEEAKNDYQLALYSIAVKELYQDCKEVKLVWHFLAHNKEVIVQKTDQELEELKSRIISKIKEIEGKISSGLDFATKRSALCDWCEYRQMCPLFNQEKLNPEEKASAEEIVNKYLRLTNEKSIIESQLDDVKEKIYELSAKLNIKSFNTDLGRLTIWGKDTFKFPGKDDKVMLELIKALKSINRFDEVAMVDTWKLAKIIEENQWPKEEIELVKAFARREKIKKIYPKLN
jgi:putative RecB family exonuclease